MLSYSTLLLALRTRLLATQVVTTGPTTLGCTGTAITRPAGSFITDGYVVGMEVVPSGFTDNTPAVIKTLTATTMTLLGDTRDVDLDGAGRSLSVGIPPQAEWLNVSNNRIANRWYVREDYIPGPSRKYGVGPGGSVEHAPMYFVILEAPKGYGATGILKVAQGVLNQFPPALALTLSSGETVRVSTEANPFIGQPTPNDYGTIEVPITIPLSAWTSNPI